MKVSNLQKMYQKTYDKKNRDYTNYIKHRSAARGFINKKATNDDLDELNELIKDRDQWLKDNNYQAPRPSNDK